MALEEVDAVRRGFKPILRVGAGVLYQMAYIPSVFEALLKAVPETQLELITIETSLVVRHDHPIVRDADTRPGTLCRYPWIVYQPGPEALESIEVYFRRHGAPMPRIAVLSNSFNSLSKLLKT